MKVPAIAKRTFDQLSNNSQFMEIVHSTIVKLKKLPNSLKRSKFIHKAVDEYVEEVFKEPLVQQLSPCKEGCSACCHSQVSATIDEAELLVRKIQNGITIDEKLLSKQASVPAEEFFQKLTFDERRCVFLDEKGACRVYQDRPSVCRTNAVLGSSDQCDTRNGEQNVRLVLTQKADMVVYASFYSAQDSGTLPEMLQKALCQAKIPENT